MAFVFPCEMMIEHGSRRIAETIHVYDMVGSGNYFDNRVGMVDSRDHRKDVQKEVIIERTFGGFDFRGNELNVIGAKFVKH